MKRATMWMAVWILISGAQVGALESTDDEIERSFVGAWTLESFESFGEDGAATPRSMSGSIVYSSSGRMAAQLMPDGYEKRAETEQGRADRSGYTAYFGRFSIDSEAGSVTHQVEGSILPQWVGRELVRYYELSDDTLKLSLRNDEGRTTGTLTWRRTR